MVVVKNREESETLSHLPTSTLACHCFLVVGRKLSWVRDSGLTTHSTASGMSVVFMSLPLKFPRAGQRTPDGCPVHRRIASQMGLLSGGTLDFL